MDDKTLTRADAPPTSGPEGRMISLQGLVPVTLPVVSGALAVGGVEGVLDVGGYAAAREEIDHSFGHRYRRDC
ncbi:MULTISPECIES: hypothetical protein [Rhodococcus]|uniref:hypothetical protein n=1 Tax=Rhodococcus TaxID=1827 RepID=UPI001009B8E2|nr:hypothetical protein [Rhodococcus opacus]